MSKKVLVVDDSASMRQQVSLVLTDAGFEVVEAADGLEGSKVIKSDDSLSAVVCDVNMPNMNGIEMLQDVKPGERGLPVLMLTTEGQPALIQQAKKAGAKGWIVKPFKPKMLVAAIQKITAVAA